MKMRRFTLLNLCYSLMTKTIVTAAALLAALVTVLGSRFVVPALILVFRSIEAGFAPADNTDLLVGAMPAAVTEEVKPKPRKARRRRPSAATLKAIEGIA